MALVGPGASPHGLGAFEVGGVTELAIDKLLQDDLPKWRRKPKEATGVLTLPEKPTQHDFTIFYLTFLWILWFPSCQSPTAKHVMLLRASRCASFFAQFVGIGLGMKIGKLPLQKAVAYCIQLYKCKILARHFSCIDQCDFWQIH